MPPRSATAYPRIHPTKKTLFLRFMSPLAIFPLEKNHILNNQTGNATMTPPWFYRAIPVHQNQRFAVAKGLKLGHRDKWPFYIAPGTCLSSIFGLEPSKRRPKLHSKQGAPFGLQVYMSCNCWRLEKPVASCDFSSTMAFWRHRNTLRWQNRRERWQLEVKYAGYSYIYMIPVRGSLPPPPPPTWYGPKTCVLQHSAWKRCICSVFCMVGCWCGPQPCKFVGFLQPTFRKRVICNVSASTSWSSAAAPSSISASNYHIILNLRLTVFSLGTGLISVYILCLSNFLLECLVFRNWSNLKFS